MHSQRFGQLLAADPHKRQAEILLLCYSPVWIAAVAAVLLTGAVQHMNDASLMALGIGLALPPWLLPLWTPAGAEALPYLQRPGTRAAAFITVMALVQNYFGSALFFDGLGMQYHFPVRLIINRVPVFLFPLTVPYFSTYYVVMQIGWRACRKSSPSPLVHALGLLALSYAVAFAETWFMANDALRPCFAYADKSFVLRYGSLCYGAVFFLSLPWYYRMDEDPQAPRTPLRRVVWDALAANMAILICYEVFLQGLLRLR